MLNVNMKKLKTLLNSYIVADIPVCIHGSPGTGKTAIVESICKDNGYGFTNLLLSIRDSVDIHGLPDIKDGRMNWALPKEIPLTGDDVQDTHIVFLDEITTAPSDVQSVAYQLVNERRIDNTPIHPNVRFILATNLSTDRAIVNEMSSALRNRLAHVEYMPETEEWCSWARTAGVDAYVTSFLEMATDKGHCMSDADIDNYAFPTYRTWKLFSDYVNSEAYDVSLEEDIAVSLLGPVAYEFMTFKTECSVKVTPKEVLEGDTNLDLGHSQKVFMINNLVSYLHSYSKNKDDYSNTGWYVKAIDNLVDFCKYSLDDDELTSVLFFKIISPDEAGLTINTHKNEDATDYFWSVDGSGDYLGTLIGVAA